MPYTYIRTLATVPECDGTLHYVLASDQAREKPLAVLATLDPTSDLNRRKNAHVTARDLTDEHDAQRIAAEHVIDSIIGQAGLAETRMLAALAREATGYHSALPDPDADIDENGRHISRNRASLARIAEHRPDATPVGL